MFNDEILDSSNIYIENRNKLSVSGVKEVESFSSDGVVFYTVLGQLSVRGFNLKLTGLENDTGVLNVEGNINGIVYTDDRKKSGFIGRLFR